MRALVLSEVQDQIVSGDVFLFRGRRLFSRLIQWKTRSVYSHVGVALWIQVDGLKRLSVMEALEGVGVRLYPLDEYLEECQRERCAVEWFQVTDPKVNRDKIASYVLSRWAKKYAPWWQLLATWGLLSRALAYWGRRLFGMKTVDPNRDFCSELCTAAFISAGYKPDECEVAAATDPGAVSRFTCLQRRGFLSLGYQRS